MTTEMLSYLGITTIACVGAGAVYKAYSIYNPGPAHKPTKSLQTLFDDHFNSFWSQHNTNVDKAFNGLTPNCFENKTMTLIYKHQDKSYCVNLKTCTVKNIPALDITITLPSDDVDKDYDIHDLEKYNIVKTPYFNQFINTYTDKLVKHKYYDHGGDVYNLDSTFITKKDNYYIKINFEYRSCNCC